MHYFTMKHAFTTLPGSLLYMYNDINVDDHFQMGMVVNVKVTVSAGTRARTSTTHGRIADTLVHTHTHITIAIFS